MLRALATRFAIAIVVLILAEPCTPTVTQLAHGREDTYGRSWFEADVGAVNELEENCDLLPRHTLAHLSLIHI